MKKIVFGITSLGIGGAERVLVDIVNQLKDNYDITIFTLYGKGEFEKQINKNIKIINLFPYSYDEMNKFQKKIIPIYILNCGKKIYKKHIKGKFDCQIAFLEGPITRIFQYGKETKKMAWIHNDMSKVFGTNWKAKLKLKIDKKIYNKYEKIIFVSKDNQKSFNQLYKSKKIENKQEVIYNYIDKNNILEKAQQIIEPNAIDTNEISIITVARLVKQKAIDRIIRVHKKLLDAGYMHKIYIIGDGPEKENLKELTIKLNVKNTVIFMGKKENPYPYIKKADYFALLSQFEGYGMVIEEAKILNKKIIITDTAAKEAVEGYSKKIILENTEDDIFNGLKNILEKENIFIECSNNYNNNNIIQKIEKIIGDQQ